VPDTVRGSGTVREIENFCSKTCTFADDCGAGYDCTRVQDSPVSFCVPQGGFCAVH
jgi:hypothetical protein